jgi:hypothetical protein
MKIKYFSALVFSTVVLFSFSSSDIPIDQLVAGFKKYLEELLQENVYLHFDQTYYTGGETIWFKVSKS